MDCYGEIASESKLPGLFYVHLTIMNILRSWREQKILLKRRFPILSDDDFRFKEEDLEEFSKHLEVRLGKTRKELELIFAEIQRS